MPLRCDWLLLIFYFRVRKEGETTEDKLSSACSNLVAQIDDPLLTPGTAESIKYKPVSPAVETEKFQYDVFISYSHKNPEQAEALLQAFAEVDKTVKVFYDRSALTTGKSQFERYCTLQLY